MRKLTDVEITEVFIVFDKVLSVLAMKYEKKIGSLLKFYYTREMSDLISDKVKGYARRTQAPFIVVYENISSYELMHYLEDFLGDNYYFRDCDSYIEVFMPGLLEEEVRSANQILISSGVQIKYDQDFKHYMNFELETPFKFYSIAIEHNHRLKLSQNNRTINPSEFREVKIEFEMLGELIRKLKSLMPILF